MPVDPYDPVNPVDVGLATKVDQWDTLWNNVQSIYDSLRGVHEIFIPATAFRPHTSGGCGALEDLLLSSGRYIAAYPFGASAVESLSMVWEPPRSWDLGTVTFQPSLLNTAGGSGAVVMQMAGVAVSDNDTLDAAVGTFQTSTDAVLAAENRMLGPESSPITIAGTPAALDLVRFVVQRDPVAGGDTYGSVIYFTGMRLRITTTWPTDDV